MTRIVCRKNGPILTPVDEEGFEVLAKLRDGRDVMVDVTAPRSIRHHRLFFALCKFCQMHCELWSQSSVEEIKDALKLATGLVRRYVSTETAATYLVLRHMNFESMDQTAFNEFFTNAVEVICKRWMPPGTLPADVERELLLMVDGPHAVESRT
jgi:hypothetical protein